MAMKAALRVCVVVVGGVVEADEVGDDVYGSLLHTAHVVQDVRLGHALDR